MIKIILTNLGGNVMLMNKENLEQSQTNQSVFQSPSVQQKTQLNLEQFMYLILQETSIQEQLKSTTDVEKFLQIVVQIGRERGYVFTEEDVKKRLFATQQELEQMYELNDEAFIVDILSDDTSKQRCYTCCNGSWVV